MDKEHLNIHDPHHQYVWADDPPPRGWRLVVSRNRHPDCSLGLRRSGVEPVTETRLDGGFFLPPPSATTPQGVGEWYIGVICV
jgi:hypothetical protein